MTGRLKIPPPLIGLSLGALMWGVAQIAPLGSLVLPLRGLVAVVLAVCGFLIDAVSVLAFFSARTTINPLAPDRTAKLVTIGMYRYSRNPMYLGMLLMLCGWAVWLAQPLNVLLLGAFVWLINTLQILPEEAILLDKFGEDYRSYCAQVRRWI